MDISLIDGWFPWALRLLALAALAAAIGWRDADWRTRRLPLAVGLAVAVTVLVAGAVLTFGDLTDPLPFTLWIWLALAVLGIAVLGLGWPTAHWWQRAAVPVAVVFALLAGGNVLNISTGYYPTVDDAISDLTGEPVPQQISLAQALKTVGRTKTGRVVAVDIPATASGFAHRQELVYLPPAWFRSKKRPKLPTVEMIGGEFAAPENWIRTGNAVQTADRYAAAHDGYAPVLVFADATGGFKTDTECVNGPAGHAEDHLVKDIPGYVSATFGTAPEPKRWAIAGWSMGGTCAVMLTVMHPDVFGHFVDISGDAGPNSGNKQQTIDKLFGGDAKAWDDHDPATVMATAKKGRYKGVSGWFTSGDEEDKHIAQAHQLEAVAKTAGISVKVTVEPGKHVWQFAAGSFERTLPWLAEQVGTPTGRKPAGQPTAPVQSPSPAP